MKAVNRIETIVESMEHIMQISLLKEILGE